MFVLFGSIRFVLVARAVSLATLSRIARPDRVTIWPASRHQHSVSHIRRQQSVLSILFVRNLVKFSRSCFLVIVETEIVKPRLIVVEARFRTLQSPKRRSRRRRGAWALTRIRGVWGRSAGVGKRELRTLRRRVTVQWSPRRTAHGGFNSRPHPTHRIRGDATCRRVYALSSTFQPIEARGIWIFPNTKPRRLAFVSAPGRSRQHFTSELIIGCGQQWKIFLRFFGMSSHFPWSLRNVSYASF
jgi:hypothetical protein